METRLLSAEAPSKLSAMDAPLQPVSLSPAQLDELARKLSTLRHDINGDLALIVAATELIKLNPDMTQRMLATLMDQPPKIRTRMDGFAADLRKLLGLSVG